MNEWASKDERGGMRKMHEEGGRGAQAFAAPDCIEVRGARVHNLKNIDVDIPLGKLVGIAGVPARVKARFALGVLYRRSSRRYLDALSTYTRRRIAQDSRPQVDRSAARARGHCGFVNARHSRRSFHVRHLHGAAELSSRLLFSRVAEHVCPHGHYVPASVNVALEKPLACPVCGAGVFRPRRRRAGVQQCGRLSCVSGHRRGARSGRIHVGTGRIAEYPRRRCGLRGVSSCGRSCHRWRRRWACA